MATTGIVLRMNLADFSVVSSYYGDSHREPTRKGPLAVDRTDVFNNNFKHLCETMLAKQRSHVVVICHGNPDEGMTMPISSATKVSIGPEMLALVRLVDKYAAVDGKPSALNADLVAETAERWSVGKSTLLSLVDTCFQIRWSPACAAVHVRACNIGKDVTHLQNLQRLFGSVVVSAPDCPMFYTRATPGVVTDVAKYASTHRAIGRRYLYEAPGRGPFLLDIEKVHTSASSHNVAVQKHADIQAWANEFYENTSSASSNTFVVAGMYPDDDPDYYLAHEQGYIDHIVAYKP